MNFKLYSPHILVYKPQTNSTFSLFLRFILAAAFVNFLLSVFSFNILSNFTYSYFLDSSFITEFILLFYLISSLGEEFIDYDNLNVNYLDIDLVSFFNFFFAFSLLLILLILIFLSLKFIWWTAVIAV